MIYVYLSTEVYDPASFFIRYGTHSRWSHAGFYDSETKQTLSAMPTGGVQYRKLPNDHILLRGDGVEEAYAWAQTQLGKPYDWTAITGFLADRNWHDTNHWFCSELVTAAFEKTGNPLFNVDAKVWRITPQDVYLTPRLR